jgi:hypothetical protein
MLLLRPAWGLFIWWPFAFVGLSLLLMIIALAKGATMAAQRRIEMLDAMNDCNAGIPLGDDY